MNNKCSCQGLGCKLCKSQIEAKTTPRTTPTRKYHNRKTTIDGYIFDSLAESRFYSRLKLLLAAGQIEKFELQPKFVLQPPFQKNGETFKEIAYYADFLIYHLDGTQEIVDIKGMETKEFLIKRKLFEFQFPDLEIRVMAELPKKYGGGMGAFMDLKEIKLIQKEAVKNERKAEKAQQKAKRAYKKTKQAAKRASKSLKS